MKRFWALWAAVTLLAAATAPAHAADLSKIDRSIKKEPAYRGKPKYCLLVFGPEARAKVWLVLDGDVLYVDRNGNGDLTEPGEKVAAEEPLHEGAGSLTFHAGEVRVGGRRHLNLTVWVTGLTGRDSEAPEYRVDLDVEVPGYKGLGAGGRLVQLADGDADGLLQFADRPQEAPVIHFGGPWTLILRDRPTLWLERTNQLCAAFGTPGLGPGTFAYVGYGGVVPENAAPRAEISFPSRRPGGPPVVAAYDLTDRC